MRSNTIYHIAFPKLNLNFELSPEIISAGSISVRWYGVILSIAFLCAFFYIFCKSKEFDIKKEHVYDLTFASAIPAIIGARLYYVTFFPGDFYIRNPEKIFAISEGGIAIYGAIIGGALGAIMLCMIKKLPILKVLDLLSLGVVIGQAIGRWGNFVNQEAFGEYTDLPWGMMSENTSFQTVHPCFLYESLGCLAIFLILHFTIPKLKITSGAIFLTYTMLYGALRFMIESLRTDSLIIPNTSVRVSQLLALLLCIISASLLIIIKLRNPHTKQNT